MANCLGYRFHPTEEEIVSHFLAEKLRSRDYRVSSINEVNINKFEPWDLPGFSAIGSDDPVWYFFTELDYMDTKRIRVNRKTEAGTGYWKITGKDRLVKNKDGIEIGSKKTLVFYSGGFPNGLGTHWVIQEFHYKDANKWCQDLQRPYFVLCRLKNKSKGGDEPSRPQLPSNSGNCILPQDYNSLSADLTGYRFHPTEEEIVSYFLAEKLRGRDYKVHSINEVDINKFEPWVLRDRAALQSDPVWHFFTKPDYMDADRTRVKRKTEAGFWKVTGRDRPVKDKDGTEIGSKKTLVFYLGRTCDGVRTPWVIQEFHHKDANKRGQRPFVLCRLKNKSKGGDNSGNFTVPQISLQENHELSLDLQSFLNSDELDYNSLSAVQFVMDDEPDHDEDWRSYLNNDMNI